MKKIGKMFLESLRMLIASFGGLMVCTIFAVFAVTVIPFAVLTAIDDTVRDYMLKMFYKFIRSEGWDKV